MSATRRHAQRGMTLIEITIAAALLAIALAAAASLVLAAGRMARNSEEIGLSDAAARGPGEAIANMVRAAGLGAPRGLWMSPGGAPVRVSPIFGGDAATPEGWDDLWLVVPSPEALREPCSSLDTATTVAVAGLGPLQVACTAVFYSPNTLMVASNMSSGALFRLTTWAGSFDPTTPSTIEYLEQGDPGFSSAPEKNGFQVGDMVYPVNIFHYYVAPNPATGVPALWRARGTISGDPTAPFMHAPPAPPPTPPPETMLEENIEDFQVTYGVDEGIPPGNPIFYTYRSGLPPDFNGLLRSVRINVVARSRQPLRDWQDQALGGDFHPLAVENHAPAATADGYRRSWYRWRVEIPNMSAGAL